MIMTIVRRTALAVALVLTLGIVAPLAAGFRPIAVLSGSMTPAFGPGDAVIVSPYGSHDPGDVVSLRIDGEPPTYHRLMAINANGTLVTAGDHNGVNDPWSGKITMDNVEGEVVYSVPKAGFGLLWAKSHLILVILAFVALLAIYLLVSFLRRRQVQLVGADERP